jgi:hypothetical protein
VDGRARPGHPRRDVMRRAQSNRYLFVKQSKVACTTMWMAGTTSPAMTAVGQDKPSPICVRRS